MSQNALNSYTPVIPFSQIWENLPDNLLEWQEHSQKILIISGERFRHRVGRTLLGYDKRHITLRFNAPLNTDELSSDTYQEVFERLADSVIQIDKAKPVSKNELILPLRSDEDCLEVTHFYDRPRSIIIEGPEAYLAVKTLKEQKRLERWSIFSVLLVDLNKDGSHNPMAQDTLSQYFNRSLFDLVLTSN